jgi:hypothetical protein
MLISIFFQILVYFSQSWILYPYLVDWDEDWVKVEVSSTNRHKHSDANRASRISIHRSPSVSAYNDAGHHSHDIIPTLSHLHTYTIIADIRRDTSARWRPQWCIEIRPLPTSRASLTASTKDPWGVSVVRSVVSVRILTIGMTIKGSSWMVFGAVTSTSSFQFLLPSELVVKNFLLLPSVLMAKNSFFSRVRQRRIISL